MARKPKRSAKKKPAKQKRGEPAKRKPARARKRTLAGEAAKRASPSFAKELDRKDRAIDELRGKVRAGSVRLATTRNLTPTKAGFRALAREVRAVRAAQVRGKGKARAYSFQLSVRYRGADGRFKKLDTLEGSFPLPKALKRRRKKGESEAQAFQRLTETKIKAAVFRAIDRAEGVAGYTPAVERALASGDRGKITRAMRAFKKRRGVTFKLNVDRQVTRSEVQSAAKKSRKKAPRKAKAVRRRTR